MYLLKFQEYGTKNCPVEKYLCLKRLVYHNATIVVA